MQKSVKSLLFELHKRADYSQVWAADHSLKSVLHLRDRDLVFLKVV